MQPERPDEIAQRVAAASGMLRRVLPERLKKLRQDVNLSQRKLAQLCGVSAHTVTVLESGRGHPKFLTLVKLTHFFRVSLDYLSGHDHAAIPVAIAKLPGPKVPAIAKKCHICDGLLLEGEDKHPIEECLYLNYSRGVEIGVLAEAYKLNPHQVFEYLQVARDRRRMHW